jgi:hypothetical protein
VPKGLKLHPTHPRRSAEGSGRYRLFAAVSWFCEAQHLQRLRRHHADVDFGGEPVQIPTASRAVLPLNISQDGAELLVKDNQGADYRGRFRGSQSSEVRPTDWALLSGSTRPGRPMAGCWFTPDGSELFLAKSDGTESRKLVSVTGRGFYPAWSPTGTKLRFTVIDDKTGANSLSRCTQIGSSALSVQV